MREDKRGSGIVVKPERARQYPWKSIKGGYARGGSEGFDGVMTGRDRHREGTAPAVDGIAKFCVGALPSRDDR